MGLEAIIELTHHLILPLGEVSSEDMLTGLTYQTQVEGEVVYRSDLQPKDLVSADEVMQVSQAVLLVDGRTYPSGSMGLNSCAHFALRILIVP